MTSIGSNVPSPSPHESIDASSDLAIDTFLSKAGKTTSATVSNPVLSDFLQKVESGGKPSLDDPAGMSTEQLMILVTNLMNKLGLLMSKASEGAIKIKQNKAEDAAADRLHKLEEQRNKAKKAKKSGLIGRIFGWIATAIALVAAAIVAVVSFGAGAALVGVVAVAGAALAVSMLVLNETHAMEKMMKPMIDSLIKDFEKMGLDPKKAKLAGNIMGQIIVAAVVITAQIAMTVVTFGANSAGMASTFLARFTSISAKIAKYASKAIAATVTVANLTAAGATVAAGASNITGSVYQKQSLDAQAQSIDLQAMMDHLQQQMDRIREFIAMLIKLIAQNNGSVNDVVDLQAKTRESVISGQKNFA